MSRLLLALVTGTFFDRAWGRSFGEHGVEEKNCTPMISTIRRQLELSPSLNSVRPEGKTASLNSKITVRQRVEGVVK